MKVAGPAGLAAALCWSMFGLRAAGQDWPAAQWKRATPAEAGMAEAMLHEARDYAMTGGGSGYVVRGGRLVYAWGDPRRRYDLKSTTKSIGVTALGLAIGDGKIKLSDKAVKFHPTLGVPPEANRDTGWIEKITILHLATQTAGFDKPGGYTKLLFAPGTRWHYSDGGPNWLAECITRVYRRDLNDVMFQRVFTPLGITQDDLTWRNNAYRDREIDGVPRREFGSGISANVDAMARIGLLYLRGGRWGETQILPRKFVDAARTTVPAAAGLPEQQPETFGNASGHYGLLWWNNADGALRNVPRDAFWSWGLYDSLVVVIPSLDVVVSRAGRSWQRDWRGHYDVLRPFLEPIAASVSTEKQAEPSAAMPPYPPSPVIAELTWAPAASIARRAHGSDNWPITWADDGNLYTAYGDGWGFEPRVDEKLSLGLARVAGDPQDQQATNIRSPTGEQRGDGPSGKKASGMLMVEATLYMWLRNAGNAQLAWSRDHAKTWEFAEWTFTTSFGYPTFLNFGRNYGGARDAYVYTYSHDNNSAYAPADRMVLARVPKDRIAQRNAYEFFAGGDDRGDAHWTPQIAKRAAVFTNPGRCYRSGISYNAALKRYLWCQVLPGDDPRYHGGLGIYDAPEPWGPWTTVYFTPHWDVGPGETASFPTKWISPDGRTLHFVFSGNDAFSVRKATLALRN